MSKNVISEEPLPSEFSQLPAEVTAAIKQLQTERDELRGRVAQLEAECRRLSYERSILLQEWADTKVSPDELERARNQPGGRTWAEIRERLEKL